VNHPDDTCPHCGHHWRHHDRSGCHFPTTPDAECNCLRWSPYPRGFPDPERTAGVGWLYAAFAAITLAVVGALGAVAAARGCGG
jgi:hypothetical protein